MGARQRMKHRATIQRDATNSTDPWGGKDAPDWQEHLADLPCHAWVRTGVGMGSEEFRSDKVAVVENRHMIVPLGTDITERDRVLTVTDRQDAEILDGPMRIESIGKRRDHIALVVERIDR